MPKYEFSVDGVSVEAVFNKLGGAEGARRFLRDELVLSEPVRRWRVDENGLIRFSLISTGETGAEWADWYKANYPGELGDEAEFMIRSADFQPSKIGTVYEIAVLPGGLWKDADRITSNIRAKADDLGFKQGREVNPEIACLIRRTFSNEEIKAMGLTWIITLHEPIRASVGSPSLLGANRCDGDRGLCACYDEPGSRWDADDGFAALVSPVSSVITTAVFHLGRQFALFVLPLFLIGCAIHRAFCRFPLVVVIKRPIFFRLKH